MNYFFLGCLIHLVTAYENDESISFSLKNLNSFATFTSYWHGNITLESQSSIFDGIQIKLYLNKFQGLLFYSIDSKFRTLWIELSNEFIKINWYNFITHDLDNHILEIRKSCNISSTPTFDVEMKLLKQDIIFNCNKIKQIIEYTMPPDPIMDDDLQRFLENMVLPVPKFNNISDGNEVHLWIGNTPFIHNTDLYNNVGPIKSFAENLLGCVVSFIIKETHLKLATTGEHYGDMISFPCRPICDKNSCYNGTPCFELWRQRFKCDCGISQFIGERCDQDISIKFNNQLVVKTSSNFKELKFSFQKLQFSFKAILNDEARGQKLLSLKFSEKEFLYMCIDENDLLRVAYVSDHNNQDISFNFVVVENELYSIFIERNLNNVTVKVVYQNFIKGSRQFNIRKNNLVIKDILVSDIHNNMKNWYKKFTGCISNLMLQSGTRKFIWNEIDNFTEFPSCKVIRTTIRPKVYLVNNQSFSRNAHGQEKLQVANANITYIIIPIIFVVLVSFGVIFYKWKRSKKKLPFKDQIKFTSDIKEETEKMTPGYSPYPTYVNHPSTFKPPYKARSMSYTSANRSMTSLPSSICPTIATPEEFEKEKYYNRLVSSNTATPKIKWKYSLSNTVYQS